MTMMNSKRKGRVNSMQTLRIDKKTTESSNTRQIKRHKRKYLMWTMTMFDCSHGSHNRPSHWMREAPHQRTLDGIAYRQWRWTIHRVNRDWCYWCLYLWWRSNCYLWWLLRTSPIAVIALKMAYWECVIGLALRVRSFVAGSVDLLN